MAQKNELIKLFDELPWIVKLILCIPALNIAWAVYRIIKGVTEHNTIILVMGIVWVFGACTLTWLLDLIWVARNKQPLFA